MKKIILLVLFVLSLSILAGCATTKNVTEQSEKIEAPEWYLRGAKKGSSGIYAIGRSNLSDKAMAEKAARVDGRAQLAQMVESTVSHVVDSLVEYDSETKRYLKESTKIVSNQVLVGSTQEDKFYFNGEMSVLMFLPYENMILQLKNSASSQSEKKLKEFLSELTVEQLENAD